MKGEQLFGLIGYPLSHSFSKNYFSKKFKEEGIVNARYENFEISNIKEVEGILSIPTLVGINITIPYKQKILLYATKHSPEVNAIGAANCLHLSEGHISAFNTDIIGIKESLEGVESRTALQKRSALILGTGGVSLAVQYVLKNLGIPFRLVSREGQVKNVAVATYDDINKEIINRHNLIINTTPLGMYPNTNTQPPIPYEYLSKNHFLFDLIYNPPMTAFLKQGKTRGCKILNGEYMLQIQANHSWTIWNS